MIADDVRRYLRGEPAPNAEAKRPWLDRLRADVTSGRAWRRIHAVTQPLSDYVRYECEWGYVPNSAAGEQIRIAELLWNQATNFTTWWDAHPRYHRDTPVV